MSNQIIQIGELAYSGKINFSSIEIELSCIPELWKCHRCSSAFVENILEAETAQSLYAAGQVGVRWPSIKFNQAKTEVAVQLMSNVFDNGGSVLDVGCNTGELLDFAREHGCETSGVEFSSASREVLHGKGHRAYTSLVETPGVYDVISAFDVVEHLYDVPAFIEACIEKLSEQGRLIVMTGNIGSLSARLSGKTWWYAQFPEHIVFPSKNYFSDYSGLKIEKWIPSYPAKNFEYPKYMGLRALMGAMLGRHAYTGLPSLFPDHALIVLKK